MKLLSAAALVASLASASDSPGAGPFLRATDDVSSETSIDTVTNTKLMHHGAPPSLLSDTKSLSDMSELYQIINDLTSHVKGLASTEAQLEVMKAIQGNPPNPNPRAEMAKVAEEVFECHRVNETIVEKVTQALDNRGPPRDLREEAKKVGPPNATDVEVQTSSSIIDGHYCTYAYLYVGGWNELFGKGLFFDNRWYGACSNCANGVQVSDMAYFDTYYWGVVFWSKCVV